MTCWETLDLTGLKVLDGGLATELERAGCDLSTPLWSAEILRSAPERVRAVHRAYLEAGADCILTASYQVSAMGFREAGLNAREAEDALRSAVRLAVQARAEHQRAHPRPIWIAASLGPYGAALHNGAEFHGEYSCSFGELVAFHRDRICTLADTDADFLAFETVPLLEEARAILLAMETAPEAAAYISFQCRDAERTAHGERIADCARLLEGEPRIIAVGVNCTAPALIESLIGQIRSVTAKRIVVYPNSGERWNAATRGWSGKADPLAFGALAARWRAAGADWIGGCCRTTPEHIRAIAANSETSGAPPALSAEISHSGIMRQ